MPMFLAVAVVATPVSWTVGGLCVLARRGSAAARATAAQEQAVGVVAPEVAAVAADYAALPAAA